MPGDFRAETFQNEFLPAGSTEVHAIMTVTAGEGTSAADGGGERLFGILLDCSGSMEGGKLVAAKSAVARLVELLPDDASFFIVAGADMARLVSPPARATAPARAAALAALGSAHAGGGTRISHWLELAQTQFRLAPGGVRQAVLLTDGQNDRADATALEAILSQAEGTFQCDCRGVGTDWQVEQLRHIAGRLLGTTDIIPAASQIEADFRAILAKAMSKTLSDVFLRLWTPQGAHVKFCKEVSPEIVDLTGRAREVKPQVREHPTGAWGKGESRDFHFSIEVQPGAVGDEVLAGRASLVYTQAGVEQKVAEARILAVWTDDEDKSTKINHVVAHYTGQAELAQSIQGGLDARAQGDEETATALLGKAVKIAHDSGNEATAKLLRRVVEVEDAEHGTVRLKGGVAREDAMALETRSTKTTRIPKRN